MNAFQYAFFRAARQRMSPEELDTANALMEKAEAGNHTAATTLRNMCDSIVRRKDGETGGNGEREQLVEFRIDLEFKSLIPSLREDERQQLEENLAANGCRDPLVTWRGFLIDGHNRYEICERRNIRYRTVEVALASRAHVLLWIEENQLGRRNLTDDQRAAISEAIVERRTALAKLERAKKGGRGHKRNLSETVADKFTKKDSRRAVSKAAKVSEWKVRAVREIKQKLGAAAVAAIRAGEKTILETKTEIRRAERIERVAELAAPPPLATEQRRFPILYVDPPWRYEYTETEARAIENHYPTMDLGDLMTLDVPGLTTPDCVLFMWATSPKLDEALQLLKAWGFSYRTSAVWIKDKAGMGYYFRQQHELLLIARRGDLPVPLASDRSSSVISAPREEHSKKPAVVYEIIERMYPALPKVELFARGEARPGWAVWGNQAAA